VTADFRAEKLGSKIRDAQLQLIPYMLVVGPRDAEQGTVSVRDRIAGDLGAMPLATAIEKLKAEVASKQVRQVAEAKTATLQPTGEANEY
jgi:threonyl-tRNA synthetase